MTARYTEVNTHIIDPDVSLGHSFEFLETKGVDLIAKIPFEDQVSIFYKDESQNILHGKFSVGDNDAYDGSAKVITYNHLKDATNIQVVSSFYRTNEYFYFFYERNNNVYIRSYKERQGSLGEEILLQENASFESLERVKDNFMLILTVFEDQTLFNSINLSLNGEKKMCFVYEKHITDYENDVHEEIVKQIFDLPFNDIPENLYSVNNLVEDHKKPLYISGSVFLDKREDSINGICCVDFNKIATEMNHKKEFAIIMRYISFMDINYVEILKTDNITVSVNVLNVKVDFSDGWSHTFSLGAVTDGQDADVFKTLVLSFYNHGDNFSIGLGFANDSYDKDDYKFSTVTRKSKTFRFDEKKLEISNCTTIDYLAIKNNHLSQRNIKELIYCFQGDIYDIVETERYSFNANDIEKSVSAKLKIVQDKSFFPIPNNAVTLVDGDAADTENATYVVNAFTRYSVSDYLRSATFFLYENATFENVALDSFTIYAKAGSVIDANNEYGDIYFEQGASLVNVDNANLIKVDNLFFEELEDLEVPRTDTYVKELTGPRTVGTRFIDFVNDSIALTPVNEQILNEATEEVFYNSNSKVIGDVSLAVDLENFNSSLVSLSGSCTHDLIPLNRFIKNPDGSLLDAEQNVIWALEPIYMNQLETYTSNLGATQQKYVNRFNLVEYQVANTYLHDSNKWRLPTYNEMLSIREFIGSALSEYVTVAGMTQIDDITPPQGAFSDCVDDSIPEATNVTLANYDITSTVFSVDRYNNLDVTKKGKVKNDYVWLNDGRRFKVSDGSVVSDNQVTGCPATLMFLVKNEDAEYGLRMKFDDGTSFILPKVSGETFIVNKQVKMTLEKTHADLEFQKYGIEYVKTNDITSKLDVNYANHFEANSYQKYDYSMDIYLNRETKRKETSGIVFPLKINDEYGLTRFLGLDPENNIRLSEHSSQLTGQVPFIMDYDNRVNNVVMWASLDRFKDKITFQFSRKDKSFFTNPADQYEVFSKSVYAEDQYFSAFHFDRLINQNQKLIKEVKMVNNGEIMLIGKTNRTSYVREIKSINFLGIPKRYKTNSIQLEIDVASKENVQSYINNYEDITNFVRNLVSYWKPANIILEDIVEKETLVMAKLLQDEYVQVLVGLTPLGNFNAYYNRSFDTREVSISTSSDSPEDQINWIGVPQLNATFLKSGITKVNNTKKNIKVNFETPYDNANYRAFVFAPYNAKFYLVKKDREGFIVESSSMVEQEVSWITMNTSEVINGTIRWRKGLGNGELVSENLDRITEIAINSSIYQVDFTTLGYPELEDNNYSVILSTNKNVNVWVESKTSKSFVVRRSYSGDDLNLDFMVIKGNTKWWEGLTS